MTTSQTEASDRLLEELLKASSSVPDSSCNNSNNERNGDHTVTAKIVDWEDGFCPSGCQPGTKGRMVVDQPRSCPKGMVQILQNVLPDSLAKEIYDSAVRDGVWGEYVALDKIESLRNNRSNTNNSSTDDRARLSAEAVHWFFRKHPVASKLLEDDWKTNVHGVSVWVIASGVGDSVQYHIDYAEMFRFQTNVTYPPMYGGTLHLTPTNQNNNDVIEGGGFYAHTGGLQHYKEHGYKCLLSKIGWNGKGIDNNTTNEKGGHWVEIPYRYNQGTLCDGDLPHFSAPVRSIPQGLKRVIVGFNVCNHQIGPIVEQCPEHSSNFNKLVKIGQTQKALETKLSKLPGGGLTVENCKKNPQMAAFVKLLAKKVKEHRAAQALEQQQASMDSEGKENKANETTPNNVKNQSPMLHAKTAKQRSIERNENAARVSASKDHPSKETYELSRIQQ